MPVGSTEPAQPRTPTVRVAADAALFAAFVLCSLAYVLRMTYRVAPWMYYGTLAVLGLAALVALGCRLADRSQPRATDSPFFVSWLAIMAASASMVAISMWREWGELGAPTGTSLSQILSIVLPATVAVAVAQCSIPRLLDAYAYVLLGKYALYFVLAFGTELSLGSLTAVSWAGSSSPFESSFAHDLLIIEAYFIVRASRMAWPAAILTMLSMKRASFLAAPLLLLTGRYWRNDRVRPRRGYLYALWAIGVASPLLVIWAYRPNVARGLESVLGIELDEFTSGRQTIFDIATQSIGEAHGLGWLNRELSAFTAHQFGTVWNNHLHNDTVRLYLEIGLLGLAIWVTALVFVGRRSRMAAFIVTYALFVLITSHLMTMMNFWITAFVVLALLERLRHDRDADEQARHEHAQNGTPHGGPHV